MSKPSNIIVGLDIGTTKICAIVGRANEFGKIEILGLGKSESLGVMRGVVTNISETVRSIRQAVEEAEAKSGVDIKVVNVGIAGQHIKSMQHRGVLTRKGVDDMIAQHDIDAIVEDMHRLAMLPGERIIHVIPQEFTVDNEHGIKHPIGMSGIRLEANCHIITGQLAAASNIFRCVQMAGLEVDELILEPLASSEAVLAKEEKEAGVALVDIGGGTTDIAIFQDGIIRHTAVIAMGGNIITEDIKEGCSIIRQQAELLKVRFGSALADENRSDEIVVIPGLRGKSPKEISVKNLAHIIQARMEEILLAVQSEIVNSGYHKKLIAGIVVTGGGAQLKHISQLVEFVTGYDTRVGYPNEHLAKGMVESVKSPMHATGVGLVIKGIQKTIQLKDEPQSDSAIQIDPSTIIQDKRRGGFLDSIKDWISSDSNDKPL